MLPLSRFGRLATFAQSGSRFFRWLKSSLHRCAPSCGAHVRRWQASGRRLPRLWPTLSGASVTNQPRPVLIWSLALLDRRCWTGMVGAVACEVVVDADCCATESERQLSEERARAAAATARQHAETDTQTAEARATSLEAALAVSRAMIAGIWVAFFQRVPTMIVRTGGSRGAAVRRTRGGSVAEGGDGGGGGGGW